MGDSSFAMAALKLNDNPAIICFSDVQVSFDIDRQKRKCIQTE